MGKTNKQVPSPSRGGSRRGWVAGWVGLAVVLFFGIAWAAPKYKIDSGSDMTAPPAIGAATPNTGKFTSLKSTTGVTIDAGGFVSKETVEAGGSGIIGQADSGAAINNNSRLGYFLLGGAKDASSSRNNSAGMTSYSTQAWSGTAAGANLRLEVTPNNSTSRSVAVTIGQDSTATFVASKHTSEYATNFNARTVYTEQGVAGAGDLFGFIGSGQSSLVKSGSAGTILTASPLGVGNMPSFQRPIPAQSSVTAYLNGTQTITSGSWQLVNLALATHDVGAEFDSANHRIAVKAAGTYLISATGYMKFTAANSEMQMRVQKNGASMWLRLGYNSAADHVTVSTAGVIPLAANDYIDLAVLQTTGGDILLGGDSTETLLTVQRLY